MDRNSTHYKQVELLIQVLPFVARQACFALKGGTAINLFLREMPRLSVDIDLVYLPMDGRDTALRKTREALNRISADLKLVFTDLALTEAYRSKSDALRLVIGRNGVQIKVELSPVLRGTVHEPRLMEVSGVVEDEFGYAEMTVVSKADLYAGKICAALDRQHPRDLFDIKWLLDHEGLTEEIRKAFLVYLVSHRRPMSELLKPKLQNISMMYNGEFTNMAQSNVSLEALEAAREDLITKIHQGLTDSEKAFLLSFKSRQPDWSKLGLKRVSELPAIRWKQLNLAKMSDQKHQQALERLKEVLDV